MKKLFALLLVIAMLLTALVGCNDGDKQNETPTGSKETQGAGKPATKPDEGGEDEEEEYDITELLPEFLNYNKGEVVLAVRGDEDCIWEMGLQEDDGQALSAELYERTARTEERLNIVMVVQPVQGWASYNTAIGNMRNSISTNQSVWDIIVGWSCRLPQLSSEGMFYNLHQFDYFDATNVWWSQSLAKELTVNDRMFMATGDVSKDYMENGHCVFFNQTLAKAMGKDYSTFYTTVTEGKWTFDELYDLSKDAYSNLNGNDSSDEGDQFGLLVQSTMLQAFYGAAGVNMVPNDGINRPEFSFDAEYIDNVWSKVKLLLESPATAAYGGLSTSVTLTATISDYFQEGKALFALTTLAQLKSLTNMTDGFGVLPMPKYNEAQKSHYTQLHACEMWTIPLDAKDPEMSAAVMSSMGYDSHEVVLEPHFEKLLKTRYVKDSESGYMIDTIYYNTFMNFDSIYNEVFYPGPNFSDKSVMPMFIFGAFAQGKAGSSSAWWAQNQDNLKVELDGILEAFYK